MQKWRGLKKELENAKKKRNISTKVVLFECGCSRTHFNKVIAGERKAGKALTKKLSMSLRISESSVNILITKETKNNKKIYIVILVIFAVPIIWHILNSYFFSKNKISKLSIIPVSKESRILGDSTSFIKDVTIPDGSYVLINSNFKKIWRLKNSGIVPWEDRYLMRITPFSDANCKSDAMVSIKNTSVGEEVDIEVDFTSMDLVGSCRTDWKMADKDKNIFFPNKHSMFSEVNVTNNKSLISDVPR